MECRVCYNPFDEVLRRPRNLGCGHAFCTSCLKTLLLEEGQLVCPECRFTQDAEDVCRLPVGFGILRAIEAMRSDASIPSLEEEEDEFLFIIPRLQEEKDGATNGEAEKERLKKSYRNVLWSQIYSCAEHIEDLKSYDSVLQRVIKDCQKDIHILDKITKSRQSVIYFLRDEIARTRREQEGLDAKKKELFDCKEKCDGSAKPEDLETRLPDRYNGLLGKLDNFLKVEEETTKQLRHFTSCICKNDRTLIKMADSLDLPEVNLSDLFAEATGTQ